MSNLVVAILGSDGFIGSHVRNSCINAGVSVINLEKWSGNREEFNLQLGKLRSANSESEIVLIQAAWYSTSNEDYRTSIENKNWVEITKDILDLCKNHKITFAGLGTCLEKLDITEDLYSASKSEIHKSLSSEFLKDEWIWFQIHYVYSKLHLKPAVIKRAAEAVASEEKLMLGTPHDVHDFIEVRDAADAIVHSIITGQRGTVDIGTGTTREVSKLIKTLFPSIEISKQEIVEKRVSYHGAASVEELVMTGWKTKNSIL